MSVSLHSSNGIIVAILSFLYTFQGMNQTVLKAEIILSHMGTQEEHDSLYEQGKFPPPAECFDKAVGSVLDQVLYLLLSAQPHKGLSKGIEFLQGIYYLTSRFRQ